MALLFVLAAAALVLAILAGRRVKDVEHRLELLQSETEWLHRTLTDLRRGARGEAEPIPPPPVAFPPIPLAGAAPEAPAPEAVPAPPLPEVPEAAPPFAPEPAFSPPPLAPVAEPPFMPVAAAASVEEPAPETPAPPARSFDWESFVGVKLFSWIAAILVAAAGVYFLKYSITEGWLTPVARMVIGLLAGIGLLVACELKVARCYAVTANAMDAAGVILLFSTIFASHALWHLLGAIPAFLAMTLVTAVAVALSIRRDSIFIALLGLIGGFSTPALLSTGEDRPIGLFGYLLLLNIGLAWVAYKKRWPLLTALALAGTTLYQWGWVMKFLTASKLPMALGIFAVFPVLAVVALVFGKAEGEASPGNLLFEKTTALSAALPLLFALYLAGVPAYGERHGLLFGFLLVVDVGLLAVAAARGPESLHLGGGVSTLVTFAVFLGVSYSERAWPAVLLYAALAVLLYLLAPFVLARLGRSFCELGERAVFTAPLLFFVFPLLAGVEKATAEPGLLFGTLFVLMAAVAAGAILLESGGLHFLAAFFTLAAEAVWSAEHLTQERLLPALTLYGAFALFYLGVPLAARRMGKTLKPEGSGAVVLFVSLGLLFFLATGAVAGAALWGLALLLAILNVGLLVEAASGHRPVLSLLGMVVSWVVIAVWWASAAVATVATLLVPALVVVGGFAILVVGGNLWAGKRAGSPDGAAAAALSPGVYLGLAGHVFLLFVATQKALAVPPWPLLGVLFVLDLAIGVAALTARRGELQLAALAASQVILVVWVSVVEAAPWPRVAILSAFGVVALGLGFFALSRRLGLPLEEKPGRFMAAAGAAALLLGPLVAIAAGSAEGSPGLGFLASSHVLLLALLLAFAAWTGWHRLALGGVVTTALAEAFWRVNHEGPAFWRDALVFGLPLYLLFVAYPIALGRRAGEARAPYQAAVLAGAPFFFLARRALEQGGYGDRIGLLPVAQAMLMAAVLVRLLKLRPVESGGARIALVAGAALAFITVAIPLQLEKQWITIGWALLGAALAWLHTRVPHRGLLLFMTGLLVAAFFRLVFNPAVWAYHPRGRLPIWNWYLYTYLVSALAFFAAGRFLKGDSGASGGDKTVLVRLFPAGGTVLLFLLVNIEIADFYSKGASTLTFNFLSASLAQDLTYTLGWGVFGFGLLVAGLVTRSRPVRIASLVLLLVTILKCFVHDLGRLGGLYRVGSFVGLAICLAAVAVLLQKFVLKPEAAGGTP